MWCDVMWCDIVCGALQGSGSSVTWSASCWPFMLDSICYLTPPAPTTSQEVWLWWLLDTVSYLPWCKDKKVQNTGQHWLDKKACKMCFQTLLPGYLAIYPLLKYKHNWNSTAMRVLWVCSRMRVRIAHLVPIFHCKMRWRGQQLTNTCLGSRQRIVVLKGLFALFLAATCVFLGCGIWGVTWLVGCSNLSACSCSYSHQQSHR